VSEAVSGFARALAALGEAGVEFVVVGVGGINFYARTPADAIATLDVAALLAPAVENLELALSVLSGLGYEFEAGGEPFVDLDDRLIVQRILQNGATLQALHRGEGEIDLLTSLSGFVYSDLAADSATFEVAGALIRVGRLEKLLRSKEASGRPKDIEFLKAFRARAFQDED
jgi:hypothetical protein